MFAKDIMTSPVITINESDTVRNAAKTMLRHDPEVLPLFARATAACSLTDRRPAWEFR